MIKPGHRSPHWHEKGTGITNFSSENLPLYEAAIAKYGDPSLFITDVPMSGRAENQKCHSLHQSPLDRSGLTNFWDIFRDIEQDYSPDRAMRVK